MNHDDAIKLRAVNENPTEGQKRAGNYFKAPVYVHGMRITIENPAGTTRRGVSPEGEAWESTLAHHYGYLRGTTGRDKDHLDVFLGPLTTDPQALAHVIDQLKPDGSFDEHKVMLGFPDENSAILAYHANYPVDHKGFGAITQVPLEIGRASCRER